MVQTLSWFTLIFAGATTAVFLINYLMFRRSPTQSRDDCDLPAVSVLIPARNEATNIRHSLISVLENDDVVLEVVVLDDQSTDSTAAVVAKMATTDARVRLIEGKPLPSGWCGKQYACHQLAHHAQYDTLLFLDADVRLTRDAIRRCLLQQRETCVQLLSGFPRQRVESMGEALLIPLMYLVMLTYLPFLLMRLTTMSAASAGCGQLFLTTRDAYIRSGGHAAIRASMHDGVMLPRVFRRQGMTTDVFDASDVAECRMYRGLRQTWSGLLKNAHEGIANARLILPFSFLLLTGFCLPIGVLIYALVWPGEPNTLQCAVWATGVSYLPRLLVAWRFDGAWLAAMLSPISIFLFVVLQWIAFRRKLSGSRPIWRGRVYASPTA